MNKDCLPSAHFSATDEVLGVPRTWNSGSAKAKNPDWRAKIITTIKDGRRARGGKRLLSNQSLRNKERCDLKYYNLYLFLEENQDNCSEKKKNG